MLSVTITETRLKATPGFWIKLLFSLADIDPDDIRVDDLSKGNSQIPGIPGKFAVGFHTTNYTKKIIHTSSQFADFDPPLGLHLFHERLVCAEIRKSPRPRGATLWGQKVSILVEGLRMRGRTVTVVLLAPLLMAEQQAVAENDPKVVTLSCDGKLTYTHITDSKPYPGETEHLQKVGVVVNFDERTLSFLGYVARISEVDAAYINFGGKQIVQDAKISIMGEIDRVTGYMTAMTTTETPTTLPGYNALQSHYEIFCKPTSRVF